MFNGVCKIENERKNNDSLSFSKCQNSIVKMKQLHKLKWVEYY